MAEAARYSAKENKFVQPSESEAPELFAHKRDAQELFAHYDQSEFENAFRRSYSIENQKGIEGALRLTYLMKRKTNSIGEL